MNARNYKNLEIKDNPHKVDVRQLYNDPSAQIVHMKLMPGERLKPHKTPVNVAFYILEGKPTIHVGDESIAWERDFLVESPANLVHYISNETNEPARILVIKAPRPDQQTKVL
ncbi:MAG: cupin domain-containing protein [Bacteroidales bacterium]|jgi:mannose-6-phosphate isomerase-like protein (cupin superfamily)|nr:cupin domain-containing protein [Bacteroidales bacterium]